MGLSLNSLGDLGAGGEGIAAVDDMVSMLEKYHMDTSIDDVIGLITALSAFCMVLYGVTTLSLGIVFYVYY